MRIVTAALCMAWTAFSIAAAEEPYAEEILALLQEARKEAGADALKHRQDLDLVAAQRAQQVADLPHARRLSRAEPIKNLLEEAGIKLYRRASMHQDMQRGFRYPASAFYRNWTKYETAWSKAMDPAYGSVGLATAKGEDGWLILIAVLLEEQRIPDDLRAVERAAIEAVNAVRLEHGLSELEFREELADVARRHSEDMAKRDFFSHDSPNKTDAKQRVSAAGLQFRRMGENLFQCQGVDDPVEAAVSSWMESPGHRENILTPEFEQTGIGLVVDEEGRFFFTQLFMRPARVKLLDR